MRFQHTQLPSPRPALAERQAPSNYPDFAEFLVREGIDSISLNPDSFVKTCAVIAAAEQTTK